MIGSIRRNGVVSVCSLRAYIALLMAQARVLPRIRPDASSARAEPSIVMYEAEREAAPDRFVVRVTILQLIRSGSGWVRRPVF